MDFFQNAEDGEYLEVLNISSEIDGISDGNAPSHIESTSPPRQSKRSFASAMEDVDPVATPDTRFPSWAQSSPPADISMEEAMTLPSRELRDELVLLYFRHIHPLCPFIDEYKFSEIYYGSDSDDELLEHVDIGLFQAMMFAAFTHISEHQLLKSPYASVPMGQRHLVSKVKAIYRGHTSNDHLVLTQMTLLLSYWSPCNSDSEVNRFWVDCAIRHAREARLWDISSYSGTMSCRRRILWWCCLTRDRVSACGLRVPHRLEITDSTVPMLRATDFGLETAFPRFLDPSSKKAMVSLFISLCQLGDVMMQITLFLRDKSLGWKSNPRDFAAPVVEIHHVRAFDSQLEEWRLKFQKDFDRDIVQGLPTYCKMHAFHVNILGHALAATLYLPYLNHSLHADQLIKKFRLVAMRKMATASVGVASGVSDIVAETKIEDMPIILVAWLVLPMCFYEVKRNIDVEASNKYNSNQLASIRSLIASLSGRFWGAEYVSKLMSDVGDLVASKAGELARAPAKRRVSIHSFKLASASIEDIETEILDIAAKVVDLKLAVNVDPTKA